MMSKKKTIKIKRFVSEKSKSMLETTFLILNLITRTLTERV